MKKLKQLWAIWYSRVVRYLLKGRRRRWAHYLDHLRLEWQKNMLAIRRIIQVTLWWILKKHLIPEITNTLFHIVLKENVGLNTLKHNKHNQLTSNNKHQRFRVKWLKPVLWTSSILKRNLRRCSIHRHRVELGVVLLQERQAFQEISIFHIKVKDKIKRKLLK
jgi:hypothetical protein